MSSFLSRRNPTIYYEQPQPSFYGDNQQQYSYVVPTRGNFSNNYSSPIEVRYQQVLPIQFKVFAFNNKLQKRSDEHLSNASAIYRFELNAHNQSFGALLSVLNSHGVSSQSHKFYYLDEEQDFVVLSNEVDFRYMLQIMANKGKTLKIVCEKFVQPQQALPRSYKFVAQQEQQPRRLVRKDPFSSFFATTTSNEEKTSSQARISENLIEKALDSVFSEIFREQGSSQHEEKKHDHDEGIPLMFNFTGRSSRPATRHPQRVRTIRLSDLLKNVEESPNKSQKKEEQQPTLERKPRSFEDFLAELFEQKLSERKQQEELLESNKKNEETIVPQQQQQEVVEEPKSTPVVELNQTTTEEENKEESSSDSTTMLEQQVSTQEKPLTTSQIISTYLVDDDEQDVESTDEESESDDDELVQSPQPPQQQQEYENELKLLSDMGFSNSAQNLTFLNKYNGNVERVVSELIFYY